MAVRFTEVWFLSQQLSVLAYMLLRIFIDGSCRYVPCHGYQLVSSVQYLINIITPHKALCYRVGFAASVCRYASTSEVSMLVVNLHVHNRPHT